MTDDDHSCMKCGYTHQCQECFKVVDDCKDICYCSDCGIVLCGACFHLHDCQTRPNLIIKCSMCGYVHNKNEIPPKCPICGWHSMIVSRMDIKQKEAELETANCKGD